MKSATKKASRKNKSNKPADPHRVPVQKKLEKKLADAAANDPGVEVVLSPALAKSKLFQRVREKLMEWGVLRKGTSLYLDVPPDEWSGQQEIYSNELTGVVHLAGALDEADFCAQSIAFDISSMANGNMIGPWTPPQATETPANAE